MGSSDTIRRHEAGLFFRSASFLGTGWKALLHRPQAQIQELDGLRAFAVLLVVATHCGQAWFGAGGRDCFALRLPFVQGGWVGVDLFFCLSGFFIGKQLWKELAETGSVNPGRFVLRRGLRIWPLYFTVFLLSWFLQTVQASWRGQALPAPLWPELLLLSNYFSGYWVPGSWSLSTEEQFYLSVPWIVLGLGRLSKSVASGRIFFGLLFLLAPMIRWIVWSGAFRPGDVEGEVILRSLYFPFHTHLDGLIAGMFLSNLAVSGRLRRNLSAAGGWLALGLLAVAAAGLKKLDRVLFEYSSLSLVFGGVLWLCLRSGPNPLRRFLAWRGFYVVSRLSYGMYLMHQAPLHWLGREVVERLGMIPPAAQFGVLFVLDATAAMGLALAGFVLVEQPFLNLRHRLGLEGRGARTPVGPAVAAEA